MSEIRMVCVPSGLTPTGSALLRVLVVPRLDEGALSDTGLDDWPSVLADASFELHVNVGGQLRATSSLTQRPLRARSEIWQAFFSGTGAVVRKRGGGADSVDVVPRHAPAVAATGLYRATAIDLASASPQQTVAQRLQGWPVTSPPPPDPVTSPPPHPASDFDSVLATVRQHPVVLEELGLVFELEVAPGVLRADPAGPAATPDEPEQGLLALRCPDPPLASLVFWTWTKYELYDQGFWPAGGTSTPPVRRGAIDLTGTRLIDDTATGSPPWAVTTLDVEGAVAGLDAAARRLAQPGADGTEVVLPGLRTAGLVLLRPGRTADVDSRVIAAAQVRAATPAPAGAGAGEQAGAVLSAEDLTMGYRIDIKVADEQQWRSLHGRQATYTVNGMPIGGPPGQAVPEEGHLATLAATRDSSGNLTADEIVARWSGWSLAVPVVDLLGSSPPAQQAALPYDFRWTYTIADQSLPLLRFTVRYQLRVRAADVTGGGLGPDAADHAAPPTDSIIYTRHDPIQPPTLALAGPAGLGAAVDRLVLRSDDHAGDANAIDTRQLTPPTVTRELAEQHAMFDKVSDEQSWAWVQRAMRTDGSATPAGLADPAANGINAFLPVQAGVATADENRAEWYGNSALGAGLGSWPDPRPMSITLSTAPAGGPTVTAGWAGDVLGVRLAVGREVVIELSSTLTPGFLDHFAVASWLAVAMNQPSPPDLITPTETGRNPAFSPVRRVTFVHAVRKPLRSPRWTLPPAAVARAPGSTYVGLSPSFTDDGLDPGSTGRLEIHAGWPEPAGPAVARSFVYGAPLPAQGQVALNVLHDFGDTKHRLVTYTLTAVSRYRQYFDHGDEPDADFQLVQDQAVLNVLSTVRPPDVRVTATVPSFAWTAAGTGTRIAHTRSSWRVRLQLSGSWFRTGIGERLAVIIAPPGAPAAPPFSVLGRDPAAATGPAGPALPASWCARTAGTVPGIALPDGGPQAVLALYDVFADGDSCYCDIELRPPAGAAASYAPFVRLSVARYQPDSLPGLTLSAPALADWAQLLPDRQVTVDRTETGLSVLVDGLGPATPNLVEVTLEELPGVPAGSPPPETLIVTDGNAAVPAWQPRAGTTVQPGTVGRPVTVPLTVPAAHPLRLRIREIGAFGAGPGPAGPGELTQLSPFVDVIDVPASWATAPG